MSCSCCELKKKLDQASNVPGRTSNTSDPYVVSSHDHRPGQIYYAGTEYKSTLNEIDEPRRDVRQVRKENITKKSTLGDFMKKPWLPFRDPRHYLYTDDNN